MAPVAIAPVIARKNAAGQRSLSLNKIDHHLPCLTRGRCHPAVQLDDLMLHPARQYILDCLRFRLLLAHIGCGYTCIVFTQPSQLLSPNTAAACNVVCSPMMSDLKICF